jgi:multidrug efflux system membrane fusion protein
MESASSDRPRRRSLRAVVIVVALILVAVIVYEAVTFVVQPQTRRSRFLDTGLQPVGVATIGRGDIRLVVPALGAVTPLTTVTVNSQISGVLTSVGFKEGERVHKGQFLAQIDPRPYQVALEQYQAQLARDQATLDQAKMDLTRYQTLSQQVSIARQTYEDQVYIVKQDEGTVAADRAQIKAQQLNLEYCHIVAPSDGRVGLRLVDPGNYVQAGSTTGIVVLALLKPISVIFNVPEDNLPRILARMQQGGAVPVSAFDRANVTQLATGVVASIDNEVDTTTGTVKLRASFDNADEQLFPSQFVNVSMLLDTLHDVVTVPVAAVQRGAPGTYVYLLNQDDTVSVHPIQLGAQDVGVFEVVQGLSPGDRVVTDGADRLRDGAHVRIPGTTPSPGSAPGSRGGGESGAARGNGGGGGADRREHRRHRSDLPGQPGQPGRPSQPDPGGPAGRSGQPEQSGQPAAPSQLPVAQPPTSVTPADPASDSSPPHRRRWQRPQQAPADSPP